GRRGYAAFGRNLLRGRGGCPHGEIPGGITGKDSRDIRSRGVSCDQESDVRRRNGAFGEHRFHKSYLSGWRGCVPGERWGFFSDKSSFNECVGGYRDGWPFGEAGARFVRGCRALFIALG